jgi:hypothetical protein
MDSAGPIFAEWQSSDERLAEEVAERLSLILPVDCIAGVAANARLLQQHVDILRGKIG